MKFMGPTDFALHIFDSAITEFILRGLCFVGCEYFVHYKQGFHYEFAKTGLPYKYRQDHLTCCSEECFDCETSV